MDALFEHLDLNSLVLSEQAPVPLARADDNDSISLGLFNASIMPHTQGYFHADQGYWNVSVANPHSQPQGNSPIHGHTTGPPTFASSTFDIPYYPPARSHQSYHSTVQAVPPSLPAPNIAPLAHRTSTANIRFAQHAQQGVALGHGPPPPFSGSPSPSYWHVPQQALSVPVGMPQTVHSPTFNLPPSPIDIAGGPRQESTLLSPYDNTLMSRCTSHSSMVSSPSDGSYYTPTSARGGADYFGHDRELRNVSATVGGHYSRVDGSSFDSSGPMPGTINLSRIQEGKPPFKFESAPSVTDSEGGSPVLSIHSSPGPSVKVKYCSPQPQYSPRPRHLSSSLGSNGPNPQPSSTSSTQRRAAEGLYSTPGKLERHTPGCML